MCRRILCVYSALHLGVENVENVIDSEKTFSVVFTVE